MSALTGGLIASAPAQAAPAGTACVVPGGIGSDDSFNLAINDVNAGLCTLLDITQGFTFDTTPTPIIVSGNLPLSIRGPLNDDSVLNGNGFPGLTISVGGNLNLSIERLTLTGFQGVYASGATALFVEATGNLTANFVDLSSRSNIGADKGSVHLEARDATQVTMAGRISFTDNSSTAGGALTVYGPGISNTVRLGSPTGDDTITFTGNTNTFGSGGAVAVTGNPATTSLFVYGATFEDDSAGSSGGAVYVEGNAALYDTDFTGNTAADAEGGAAGLPFDAQLPGQPRVERQEVR